MSLTRLNVFKSMYKVFGYFGLSVERSGDSHSFFGSDIWTSWIGISGSGKWVVLVTYSADLAVQIAGIMNKEDTGDITTDLVIDVLGEVNNIIAGQIKGFLDPLADISTPKVDENVECEDIFPDTEPMVELNFRCAEKLCKVVVLAV